MRTKLICRSIACVLLLSAYIESTSEAADGTWINDAGGNWSSATNWAGGILPSATNDWAHFDTLDLTNDVIINVQAGGASLGHLSFSDTSPSHNFTLTGTNIDRGVILNDGISSIAVSNTSAFLDGYLIVPSGGPFEKLGSGALVVSNYFTNLSNTVISDGSLFFMSDAGLPGTFIVATNTGALCGNGYIYPQVYIFGSASLSPGAFNETNTCGAMTLGSTNNIVEGTCIFDINTTSDLDRIILPGSGLNLDTNSAAIELIAANYAPSPSDVLWIVENQGAQPIFGYFQNMPEGAITNLNGMDFEIHYAADYGTTNMTGGNDIALLAVGGGMSPYMTMDFESWPGAPLFTPGFYTNGDWAITDGTISTNGPPNGIFAGWLSTNETANLTAWGLTSGVSELVFDMQNGWLSTNILHIEKTTTGTNWITTLILTNYSTSWTQVTNTINDPAAIGVRLGRQTAAGAPSDLGFDDILIFAATGGSSPPSIDNNPAQVISDTEAVMHGNMLNDGGTNAFTWFYWGTNDGFTTKGAWLYSTNLGSIGNGTFSNYVGSLMPDTTYYYRCYSSNAFGDSWASPSVNFMTMSGPGGGEPEFRLTVDPIALIGEPLDMIIEAVDEFGNIDSNYTGEIFFSSSTDIGASLPTNHVFSPSDNGLLTIPGQLSFSEIGMQEIYIEDTTNSLINMDEDVQVFAGGATNTVAFMVEVHPRPLVIGTWHDMYLLAIGSDGTVNTSYSDTATFSSTESPSWSVGTFSAFTNGKARIEAHLQPSIGGLNTYIVSQQSDTNINGAVETYVVGGSSIYYVDGANGSDTNGGLSTGDAWATISKAASVVGSGDVVWVAPDTYTESVNITSSGAAASWIAFIADDRGEVFPRSGPVEIESGASPAFRINSQSYVSIIGFESMFSASRTSIVVESSSSILISGFESDGCDTGIAAKDTSNLTVKDCEFLNLGAIGVHAITNCGGLIVENSMFDTLQNAVDVFASTTVEIRDNSIKNSSAQAIVLGGSSAGQVGFNHISSGSGDGIRVEFNSSISADRNIIADMTGTGISLQNTSGAPLLENNTLLNNGSGIDLISSPNSTIINNIVAYNGPSGISLDAGSVTGTTSDFNCSFGQTSDWAGSATQGTSSISADPLFADSTPGYEDVHLRSQAGRMTPSGWAADPSTSPCIDAGNTNSPFSSEPPPHGSRVNMGAYGDTWEASKSYYAFTTMGTPYSWLEAQNPAWTNDYETADTSDQDADGQTTWQEFITGHDPQNSNSFFEATATISTNGKPQIEWQSWSNRFYDVDYSTNAGATWLPLFTNVFATPTVNAKEDALPGSTGSRMYRVIASNTEPHTVTSLTYAVYHWLNPTDDGNGYTDVSPKWMPDGSNVWIQAFPTNGYTFSGWTGDVITNDNPVLITVTNPVNITANFSQNTYDISAFAATNGTISPTGTVWVSHGSNQSFTITPYTNYLVVDVLINGTNSIGPTNFYTFVNVTNGGHTIDATFAANTNSLMISSLYGSPTPPIGTTWEVQGTLINASVATPVLNGTTQLVCTGWAGTGSAPTLGTSNSVSFNITNNTTLSWNWIEEFDLTISPDPNGSVNLASGWYTSGTNLTLTATASNGYSFAGWTGDITGPDATTNILMTQALNITPTFTAITNMLLVGSLYGSPTPGIGTNWYSQGMLINASVATPVLNGTTQFVCTGWAGTGSAPTLGNSNSVSFNITNNTTLSWNWTEQHQLNASAGLNGTVTASNGWYNSGATAIVTANPDPGYMFTGWTGDVPALNTNDNPVNLTMSQARTIQANYALALGYVTVTIDPTAAAVAGAQWRMTSGPDTAWKSSGVIISNVPAGTYTITCNPPAGWTAPQDVVGFAVSNGVATSFTRTFRIGDMTLLPGGTFQMGIRSGAGGHSVTISSFYMDTKEVTVGEYQAFCSATASPMPPAPPWGWTNTNLPIVNVTWNNASAYAAWAGKRLPTEAEYEYVMRSGAANQIYPWGNTISGANANYNSNVGTPTAAGSYGANSYGIFDISGNVWEWCGDWYQDILTGPVTDPTGPGGGTYKIMRGGSFRNSPYNLECAPRWFTTPNVYYVDVGFRCASTVTINGAPPPSAASSDINKNGIDDWWEEYYFGLGMDNQGEKFDESVDSDQDGLSNADEYKAGTDPTNSASVLSIEDMDSDPSDSGFTLNWSSVPGKTYQIERCPDLAAGFEVIATDITATESTSSYIDSSAPQNSPAYYRVSIQE